MCSSQFEKRTNECIIRKEARDWHLVISKKNDFPLHKLQFGLIFQNELETRLINLLEANKFI